MFQRLFQKLGRKEDQTITIVSGLPRSGTSMMMKMLEAGGIPPLTDKIRTPDEDNPKGYYEFERVKKLDKGDTAWLPEARGKAVKVISALLKHLPDGYTYRVLFMRRKLEEVLASQKQMLIRRGEPTDRVSDEELAAMFRKHLHHIEAWARERPNVHWLDVNYNDLLANPRPEIARINRFLGGGLDEQKMAGVVDPTLYRQRR
ncbi:MAG: sulfotransferase family protein [Caldilineae bacterium]|nr:MAG: sulfotransferase family protein [Caldilineae bacterium]